MSSHFKLAIILFGLILLVGGSGSAVAQTTRWNNGSAQTSSWFLWDNWTPAIVPNAIGANATFLLTLSGTEVAVRLPVTLGTLYGLSSTDVTFMDDRTDNPRGLFNFEAPTGNATLDWQAATPIFHIPVTLSSTLDIVGGWNGKTMVFREAVRGPGGMNFDWRGLVQLAGNNTYQGLTTTTNRTVLIAKHPNALGSTASGTVINSGSQLDVQAMLASETITISGIGQNPLFGTGYTGGALSFIQDSNSPAEAGVAGPVLLAADASIMQRGTGQLTLNGTISRSGTGTRDLTLIANGGQLVFNGSIDDTIRDVTITGDGNGRTVLAGSSFYTGNTTIERGTLQIGNGGTTGALPPPGNVLNNGTVSFHRAGDYTFEGVISGSGNLTNQGGVLRLSEVQTYTGNTTISAGTLVLPTDHDFGVQASSVVEIGATGALDMSNRPQRIAGLVGAGTVYSFGGSNGTLALDVATGQTRIFSGVLGSIYPNFSLTKEGTGTQVIAGNNTYTGGTTIAEGTLQIGSGGTSGWVIGNIMNNGTVAFARSNNMTFSNIISGSGSLVQMGPGTLILTGNNTYTGGTTIAGGTLQIGTNAITGSIVGNVTNNGTLIFRSSDNIIFGGNITGSFIGTDTLSKFGPGRLTLTGQVTAGAVRISRGTIEAGSGGSITAGALILGTEEAIPGIFRLGAGAALNVGGTDGISFGEGGGSFELAGGLLKVNSSTLTTSVDMTLSGSSLIDTSNDRAILSGVLSGNGTLGKMGGGTLVLTGNNTYTGGTVVYGGNLEVNGTIGNVHVLAGAVIGGNGRTGNITLDPGAVLAPGSSFIELEAAGLVWNPGAALRFELSSASTDFLNLSGAFQKSGEGAFTFDFLDAGWVPGRTYQLAQFQSTNFSVGDFSFTKPNGLDGHFELTGTHLNFVAVPEPSAVTLLLLSLLGLLVWHRRRVCTE